MGLSKYMAIAIAVLLVALAGSSWLLKKSYEENGALRAAADHNVEQLGKATAKIDELRQREVALQADILNLGHANAQLQEKAQVAQQKFNKWRSTLDVRTLAKPEATRRAARRSIRVRQCQLWRDTGGEGKCPK